MFGTNCDEGFFSGGCLLEEGEDTVCLDWRGQSLTPLIFLSDCLSQNAAAGPISPPPPPLPLLPARPLWIVNVVSNPHEHYPDSLIP